MKKKFPLPLKINCEGLSKKHARRLAWALEEHFDYVEMWDYDEITVARPRNSFHYELAWELLDYYGVQVF